MCLGGNLYPPCCRLVLVCSCPFCLAAMRHTANLLALLCVHDLLVFFFGYCICCLPAASLCTQLVRVELRPATTPVFTSLRVCLCMCVLLLLPAFLLADYSYNILHTVASYNLKLYDRINCCAVACDCMFVCICVFSTMIQLKDMRHALFITKYLWRRKPLTIQTIELC